MSLQYEVIPGRLVPQVVAPGHWTPCRALADDHSIVDLPQLRIATPARQAVAIKQLGPCQFLGRCSGRDRPRNRQPQQATQRDGERIHDNDRISGALLIHRLCSFQWWNHRFHPGVCWLVWIDTIDRSSAMSATKSATAGRVSMVQRVNLS